MFPDLTITLVAYLKPLLGVKVVGEIPDGWDSVSYTHLTLPTILRV